MRRPPPYDHVGLHGAAFLRFTGLHDNNNQPIYEGDIVSYLNGETTSNESGMDCEEFTTYGAIFYDEELARWDVTGRIDASREDVFECGLDFVIKRQHLPKPRTTEAMTRVCTKCGCEKPLSDYYVRTSGLPFTRCKKCVRDYQKGRTDRSRKQYCLHLARMQDLGYRLAYSRMRRKNYKKNRVLLHQRYEAIMQLI